MSARYMLILIVIVTLAGCSDEAPIDAAQDDAVEPEAPQEHVLQTQFDQIDKAKALQEQLNTAAQDRLRQIDEATQRDPDDG